METIREGVRDTTCEIATVTGAACGVVPKPGTGRFWSHTYHRRQNGLSRLDNDTSYTSAQEEALRYLSLPDEFSSANGCYPRDWLKSQMYASSH